MKLDATHGVRKMMPMNHRFGSLVLAAAMVGSLGACATPDDIDRVQPDLLDKQALTGEWYWLDTVVRAPYASNQAFTGLQSSLERGVFELEKDYLYLYRTYEFVQGVDSQGIRSDVDTPLLDADGNPVTYEKTLPDGTKVTATRYVYRNAPMQRYAVLGHYDVRRQYNPLTGEESNVIVEDSGEKYWWERKFVRVDFSQHSVVASDGSYTITSGNGLYEGEDGSPDVALRIEDDGQYMDFVVKRFMDAPSTYLSGWGWVPACLFYPWYTGAYFECNPEEIHIRTAFMRVDDANTYQPLDYNDQMLGKFGYYLSARAEWDQYFGTTYSETHRNIRRFRIWKDYVDANGDGKLDYDQMEPEPIVYYLSEAFPRELIGGAIDLADEWNQPFVETVRALKDPSFDGRMFVLCENSLPEVERVLAEDPDAVLAETDPSVCKGMDTVKPLGDLRYNMLVSVNDPTQYGLYGYGPMHSDPITGEIIHANAFNYTANMRLGARTAVDMIEYAAGVQNFRDITQAQHIVTKLKAKKLAATQRAPRVPASLEEAKALALDVVPASVAAELGTVGLEPTDTDLARARMARLGDAEDVSFVWKNADMAALVGLPVNDVQQVGDPDGFLKSLAHPAHTGTEDWLLWGQKQTSKRGQQAICMGTEFDDSFLGFALEYKPVYDKAVCEGLAGRADLAFDFSQFDEPGASCDDDASACGDGAICTFLDQGEASGKYCITPCSTGALLDQLRKEIRRVNQVSEFDYWDPNALYTDVKDDRVRASQIAARDLIEEVREQVFLEVYDRFWSTVAMHEVGHNVGLRHNFASSTDALNYFPNYWNLKGFTGQDGKWHPKNLWQRDTRDQALQRMREYQETSIMEYGGAFTSRFQGLGSYDHAAIHFGYGELLHVFDSPPDMTALADYLAEPEDDQPTNYPASNPQRELPLAKAFRKIHHTNYPNVFGSVEAMYDRKPVPWQDLVATDDTGAWKACDRSDSPYDSSVCGEAGSFCQPFPTGFFCTKPEMVEVPYRFCSDEYNWTSPTCQTRDEGTDMFEIVVNSIDDYETYWPFRAYRRDNDLFNPATGYWNSVMGFVGTWRKHFEHWAYNYARYNQDNWWEKRFGLPWHLDVNGGLGDTLAAKEVFTQLANVFGRPSDGYYGWNNQRGRYEPVVQNGKNTYSNVFQVREDTGARPMYPAYDFDGYLYTPLRAGTFYDRLASIMYMTYPQMMFVRGVDRSYDMRRFRMSFNDIWPQRMQNLLSGLLTSDPVSFGWCVEHDGVPPTQGGNGDPINVKSRVWFGTDADLDDYYANCVPLTPEPEYSFPTTQYRLPALAAIYGMTWMSGTFDRTFIDRSRLWLDGEGTDITLPAGFDVVTFSDPLSGKVYKAAYDPKEYDPYAEPSPRDMVPSTDFEEHSHTYWPAAQLLGLANDLRDEAFGDDFQFSDLQQLIGRLEIVRGLYRRIEFGY